RFQLRARTEVKRVDVIRDRVVHITRELLAIDKSLQEVVFLEIENARRINLLQRLNQIGSPAAILPDANGAKKARADVELVCDEVSRERTIRPILPKKERERPPRIEECVAARDEDRDGTGEILQPNE